MLHSWVQPGDPLRRRVGRGISGVDAQGRYIISGVSQLTPGSDGLTGFLEQLALITDTDTVDVLIRPGAEPDCERKIRALPGVTRVENGRMTDGTVLLRLTAPGSADGRGPGSTIAGTA